MFTVGPRLSAGALAEFLSTDYLAVLLRQGRVPCRREGHACGQLGDAGQSIGHPGRAILSPNAGMHSEEIAGV